MPIPSPEDVTAEIARLFDAVLHNAASPADQGRITGQTGQLITLAISTLTRNMATTGALIARANELQAAANRGQEESLAHMKRLEWIGIGVGVIGVLVASLQLWYR